MPAKPKHVAIIMDGNGRWAKQRNLPRIAGHRRGRKAAERAIQFCLDNDIEVLTLWAFSTENWNRPDAEVGFLMDLMYKALQRNLKKLHENNVRFRAIGNRQQLNSKLRDMIEAAEKQTANNTKLTLNIAINYGGKWDITHAVQQLIQQGIKAEDVTEERLRSLMEMADLPDPDLFIRTSGELRLSNYILWQCAYTELYFTKTMWPDFDAKAFAEAIAEYSNRQRRFGGL